MATNSLLDSELFVHISLLFLSYVDGYVQSLHVLHSIFSLIYIGYTRALAMKLFLTFLPKSKDTKVLMTSIAGLV